MQVMIKYCLSTILLIISATLIFACNGSDDDDDNSGDPTEQRELDDHVNPDPLPESYPQAASMPLLRGPYLQNVGTDTVTVMWESTTACTGIVEFFSGDYYDYTAADQFAVRHEIVATELPAGSEEISYRIRCLSPESATADGSPEQALIGEQLSFKLAPVEARAFSFTVFGDNQDRPEVFGPLADMMLELQPDLAFSVGDSTENGLLYEDWDIKLFNPGAELFSHTPLFMAIGNHEKNSPYFYELMSQPPPENYFSFAYSNAYFVIVDTNGLYFVPGSEQMDWLEEVIFSDEAQSADWLILFNHQPPYCQGWGHPGYDGEAIVRGYLLPLVEDAGVDFVFNGHAHNYERGELHGVNWIITGGGGGGLDSFQNEIAHFSVYEPVYHFTSVSIDGLSLSLNATDLDGNTIDTFEVVKQPSADEE
jgi:Calcineurin-like phosphoesterase